MTNLQSSQQRTFDVYLLGYGLQLRCATGKVREEEEVALALTIGSALGRMGYGYDPSAFQT